MENPPAEQLDIVAILSTTLQKIAKANSTSMTDSVKTTTTLGELASFAAIAGVGIDRLLAQASLESFAVKRGHNRRAGRDSLEFIRADKRSTLALVYTKDSSVSWSLDSHLVEKAVRKANLAIELIHDLASSNDIPIFAFLGLRNLSSFVGEVFAGEVFRLLNDKLRPNPNQDGYPDLLAYTPEGKKYIEERERNSEMSVKKFWSPYPFGGIEVKATCGNVESASVQAKPKIGEARIPSLVSAEWKAHHRETNNLLAIYWDFLDEIPTVLAAFYRNDLTVDDWGEVVKPKEGAGRTRSGPKCRGKEAAGTLHTGRGCRWSPGHGGAGGSWRRSRRSGSRPRSPAGGALSEDLPEGSLDNVEGGTGEEAEKVTVALEKSAKCFRDRERQVPVGDRAEDAPAEPFGDEGRPLGLTGGAEVAGLAGERQEVLRLASTTPEPGEAVLQAAAIELHNISIDLVRKQDKKHHFKLLKLFSLANINGLRSKQGMANLSRYR